MSRTRSLLASILISPVTARGWRGLHEARRRLLRRPHRIVFYHRLTDAWLFLLAQVLPTRAKGTVSVPAIETRTDLR